MRPSRTLVPAVLAAAFLSVLVLPQPGSAQTLQTCLVSQLKYAGTSCRGMGRCYRRAMRAGVAVDPGCIPGRVAEVQSRYANVEGKGDCLVEPAGATVANMLETTMGTLANTLSLTGGKCAAGKMGALGRECKQLLRCYVDSVSENTPVDPFCLDQASAKEASVFARMEERYAGTCSTTNDAPPRDADVRTLTDDIWSYVRGTGTTTTSTTTTVSSTTTTLIPGTCPEDGSIVPCEAYRDNASCTACIDAAGGVAVSQCTAAAANDPSCGDAFLNQGCGFAINTATSCGPSCCP